VFYESTVATSFLFSAFFFFPPRYVYYGTTEEQLGPSKGEEKIGKSGQEEEDHVGIDSPTTAKGWAFFSLWFSSIL